MRDGRGDISRRPAHGFGRRFHRQVRFAATARALRATARVAVVLIGLASSVSLGQTEPPPPVVAENESPHRLVRSGNELLDAGRAREALDRYRRAEALNPTAREIAFAEGLAHFDLKEFEQARTAFERAGPFANDTFADDVLYSLGANDHSQALSMIEAEPQKAVSLLENAMQRYREVLARQPDHQAARRADYKAASTWRQLKEMMQQQQQQQQQPGDSSDEQEQQDDKPQDQQNENQSKPEEQESSPPQQQPEQTSEQPSDEQQQQSPGDADDSEKQDASQQDSREENNEKDEQAQRSASAEEREQVSREQAERKLREMMQAIRDRQRRRPQRAEPITIKPVEKDW